MNEYENYVRLIDSVQYASQGNCCLMMDRRLRYMTLCGNTFKPANYRISPRVMIMDDFRYTRITTIEQILLLSIL